MALAPGPPPPAPLALLVLAKLPVAGESKTRLSAELGSAFAERLARAFLRDSLARFGRWRGADLWLVGNRPDSTPFDSFLCRTIRYATQVEGDLGARQAAALATAAAAGHVGALLVGTDTPHLSTRALERAARAVRAGRCALAPARDGGYVLLGLPLAARARDGWTPLFENVPWSTGEVAAVLRLRLAALGLPTRTLPTERDLDTVDDLHALWRRLAGVPPAERPARTAALLERCAQARRW